MLATGEFRGTAIDCRARSSATARDPTGSQRRRSRRISSGATAVRAAAVRAAAVGSAAVRAAAVRAAAVGSAAVLAAAVQGAAVGRHNEAKPICGRGLDPKMLVNAETIGPYV